MTVAVAIIAPVTPSPSSNMSQRAPRRRLPAGRDESLEVLLSCMPARVPGQTGQSDREEERAEPSISVVVTLVFVASPGMLIPECGNPVARKLARFTFGPNFDNSHPEVLAATNNDIRHMRRINFRASLPMPTSSRNAPVLVSNIRIARNSVDREQSHVLFNILLIYS